MVGIFGLSNKSSPPGTRPNTNATHSSVSPPPPYKGDRHDSPVYATETTTTTTHVVTTTTQTTTHFFSLPLFRRRAPAALSADTPRKSMSDPSADELGAIIPAPVPVVLLRDKELPPTPSLTEENTDTESPSSSKIMASGVDAVNGDTGKIEIPSPIGDTSQTSSLPPPVLQRSSTEGQSSTTFTLACAALSVGLPPVMLNSMSAASSSSEVNTVTFATPSLPTSPAESQPSTSIIRRAKSFQKDTALPPDLSNTDIRERRRARGLSLGPLHFGADGKGKERQKEPNHDPRPSLSKSLTRKASFWTRKRNDSHPPSPVVVPLPLPHEQTLLPSLPTLQPVSPFYVDTAISPSSSFTEDYSNANTSPELRRRHSERNPSSSRNEQMDSERIDSSSPLSSPLSPRRRRPRRPQTADTAESPKSHFSSFPDSPPSLTASPPALPSPILSGSGHPTASPAFHTTTLRPRALTNPPFLHRLSINLFGSPSTPSPTITANISKDTLLESPSGSVPGSNRPSFSKPPSKPSIEIPRPRHDEESPEVYLQRLLEAVSKAEVATVLASSADDFHARALRAYIERFDFSGDPLDVALRRLLMDVGLPRETQQIDRVMEAFAARYLQCHMNLFTSDDHPYIIAFSLIMLHTDAFNKSNKRKMTKADYIKNTRLPGVPPEVLDCFYDNIIFAPFIFIEDPLDVNGQRGLLPEMSSVRRSSTLAAPSPGGLNGSGSMLLGKSNKIDPYYLITRNLLDDLRVNVQAYVPLTSPYFYQGTAGPWDENELLRAFATAGIVEVSATDSRYNPSPWFSLSVGGGPGPMSMSNLPSASPLGSDVFTLKVTKVGVLMRKDDVLEGGRKAMNRKWKEWSVLLTGSQLLLCRDSSWAVTIQAQINPTNGEVSLPHALILKPDELLSVRDAVAVFDRSYIKYSNVLRLVMPDGRQFLLQASDEREMNEWIARINYASAFKTAGVRMRSLGMAGKDIELTGRAAAASHLRDIQLRDRLTSSHIRNWDGRASGEHKNYSKNESLPSVNRSPVPATSRPRAGSVDSGLEDPVTPPLENNTRLLKATFDQVKADLASGRWHSVEDSGPRAFGRPRAYSLESILNTPSSPTFSKMEDVEIPRLSSRSKIIRSKVRDLESKLSLAQSQLDSDMRYVRNIAVLTPFQRATRERLQVAVQNVAKRIMQVRLDMEKLICHRDVLRSDLVAEERDWQRTKTIALRAATTTLQTQRKQAVPRMTLSLYTGDTEHLTSSAPIAIPRSPETATSRRPESSATESFHSALDFGSDWTGYSPPIDRRRRSTSLLGTSPVFDSPTLTPVEGRGSSSSLTFPETPERPRPPPLTAQSSMESASSTPASEKHHEKFYTAPETPEEQAEEWNKTRAAKRVSLVKLPSDLRMSVLLGKHAHSTSEPEGEPTSASPTGGRSMRSNSSPGAPYNRTASTVTTVAMLDL